MEQLIELKQEPIINYPSLEDIKQEVQIRIKKLNLETMEVSEENLKEVKDIKAELNKELNDFEEARKMIREKVEKPYKEFVEQYNPLKKYYTDATAFLDSKIKVIENEQILEKENELREIWKTLNVVEWLTFDDYLIQTNTNVIKSTTIKKYTTEMTKFVDDIDSKMSLLENIIDPEIAARAITYFKKSFNAKQAQEDATNDVNAERQIALQKQEQEKSRIEQLQEQAQIVQENMAQEELPAQVEHEPNIEQNVAQNVLNGEIEIVEPNTAVVETEVLTTAFRVTGTMEQLIALKQFLENGGYDYESI